MKFLSLAVVGLLLGACSGEPAPPPEMTNAERGQIQAEVIGWADAYLAAATNLDPHAAAALFDQADAHFMAGTTYRPTWQAYLDGTQELFGGWTAWEPEWVTKRIDVLSPEAALFAGEAAGLVRLPDGTEFDQTVALTFVLRKKDGVWTGLYGHAASARTPGE